MIIFGAIGTSKYYKEWKSEGHSVTSEAFYFESPELTSASDMSSPVSVVSAEPEILFRIRNYVDEKVDASDIPYEIEVYDASGKINYLSITDTGYSTGIRKLPANNKSEHTVRITGFRYEGEGIRNYTIKLTAKSPYEKIIEATYAVNHLNDVDYEIDTTNLPYIMFNAKANDYTESKNYTITWNAAKEIPDPTDGKLEKIWSGSGSSINCTFEPNTTYTYRFFKMQDGAGASDFKMTRSDIVGVKIGNKEYSTLADAIANVSEGGLITLSTNVALTSSINVTKSCVLDLNGCTINNNSILVSGSGTDVVINDFAGGGKCYRVDVSGVGAKATINAGEFFSTSNQSLYVHDGAEVIINGGIFYSTNEAIYLYNGKCTIYDGNFYKISDGNSSATLHVNLGSMLNIYGGVFTNNFKNKVAVHSKNNSVVNIYGGVFKGESASVAIDNGTFNVYGGEFLNTNTNLSSYVRNGKSIVRDPNTLMYCVK